MNGAGESPMDFNRIIDGVMRAARLDRAFFNMVEKDVSYTRDSLVVVLLVAAISAIGAFIGGLLAQNFLRAIGSLIWTAVWAVIAFYLWVALVHWVGTQFFKGQGDRGEVQRCLGFAYGPQLLSVFAFIPCIGGLAALVGWIWSIVVGFVAIQEALDQDTTNAVLTVLISAVIVILLTAVIALIMAAIGLAGAAISGGLSGGV